MSRIEKYVSSDTTSANAINIPVAEAMVTYKEKSLSADEESNQVFIPFVSDVRVGPDSSSLVVASGGNPSFDEDFNSLQAIIGSPSGLVGGTSTGGLSRMTPPSSPHVGGVSSPSTHKMDSSNSSEAMELQLDFWTNQQDTTMSSSTAGLATNAILFGWLFDKKNIALPGGPIK